MTFQETLFTENENLRNEVQSLTAKLRKNSNEAALYKEENERLHEIIRGMKRQIFGSKKERWVSEEQLVFNEAEVEARKPDLEEDDEKVTIAEHTKKRGKRKPLPSNLPREIVVIDLLPEEKKAADGTDLVLRVVGKEISEKVEYTPAAIKIIETHRLKYEYVKEDGDVGIITAAQVPSLIPKGIATPSLLAGIITNKYADGLPLYRQEEMFARNEIELPRATQARWIIQVAKECRPLWNLLEEKLMSSFYLSCDETWTQVLKEKGKTAESNSYMWVRCNPGDQEKIVLFDYDPSRSGAVAARLFRDYKGVLQVDGYGGYNLVEKNKDIKRIGCNMHSRRKFDQAFKEGAKSGHTLAEKGLEYYQRLYRIEERAKELNLSFDQRHELRQAEAKPIWLEMKGWADDNVRKVPPKSKIGQALNYFIKEHQYLIGYLDDGRLEIDNGFAERAIKYFAIGRNNWLFSDTEAGAEASSLFYSFVITAKLNRVNPYEALKRIFTELPSAKTADDFERLANILTRP